MKTLLCLSLVWLTCATALAHPGVGIVVDRQGRVYFADGRHNIIWKIEPDGRLVSFLTGRHSHELVLDEQGNLYGKHLSYLGNERWEFHLWKATPEGAVSDVTPPAAGFPPGLLMDRAGNRYQWSDSGNAKKTSSLIQKLQPDGTLVTLAGSGWGWADGKGAQALLGSVGGMVWGPDSALYITDVVSVRRVALDGTVTTVARGGPALKPTLSWRLFGGLGNHLMGLTVDGQRNIYVANYSKSSLVKVAPDGQANTLLHSEKGWSPTGVTLAGNDLYWLEHHSGFTRELDGLRVRKRTAEGNVVTLGGVPGPPQNRTSATVSRVLGHDWVRLALLSALAAACATNLWYWRRRRRQQYPVAHTPQM